MIFMILMTVICRFIIAARCSLYLILFRRIISEVAWPIVTKLCHMFDGDPDL